MGNLQARLKPVVGMIQAQIGDAFNLQNLVTLFQQAEKIDETTGQLAEATEYEKYIPTLPTTVVIGGTEVLQRKRGIGKGKRASASGTDIPLADVEYDKVTLPMQEGHIGYQYTVTEIETALAAGIPLDSDKAESAVLASKKHLSDVAWEGEGQVKGFAAQTAVTVVTAQHDWATATIDEVLEDINAVLTPALTASQYDDPITPDTFLLPATQFLILAGRFRSDNSDKTFLEIIKEKNVFAVAGKKLEWASVDRLNGKGLASSDRAVVYRRDPSCIRFLANDVQFLSAQPVGTLVKVPGRYKYQGVYLKRVDSMKYLDI